MQAIPDVEIPADVAVALDRARQAASALLQCPGIASIARKASGGWGLSVSEAMILNENAGAVTGYGPSYAPYTASG